MINISDTALIQQLSVEQVQLVQVYTVFRKKHPLVFCFITSSQINQFAQKFQHL